MEVVFSFLPILSEKVFSLFLQLVSCFTSIFIILCRMNSLSLCLSARSKVQDLEKDTLCYKEDHEEILPKTRDLGFEKDCSKEIVLGDLL